MFYYFANYNSKTLKMTDDLANVLTDWAEFNGLSISAVHSTSEYHVVSLDSDIDDPIDLQDALSEDYLVVWHSELTPSFFRLVPKSNFARNEVLGNNYKNWRKYSETPRSVMWDGEP